MLYRHVEQIVCDYTIYVLYTQISDDCTNISNLSVSTGVADLIPKKGQKYWLYGNRNKFGNETGKQ